MPEPGSEAVDMNVAVLLETAQGEKRVAAVPATVEKMVKAGMQVSIQSGAGLGSTISDDEYAAAGARIDPRPEAVLEGAGAVLRVQRPSAAELDRMPERAAVIAYTLQANSDPELREALKRRRLTALSLDLVPRIARAQNMDVLSSMANIAGYKSVLLAANALGKFFPMLMTAAGTVVPARVLVLGAGVAGLQAVATARRLGAVVSAFDIRPVAKEQVESLGARFVGSSLHKDAQDARGYAKEVSADAAQRDRDMLLQEMTTADVCITTALVPGKRAPILVTAPMVKAMKIGSVIVDLAAEQGGNCELTEPGKDAVKHGVTIMGPLNVVSDMAPQASQLYSRNVLTFLLHLFDKKSSALALDRGDEITRSCLVSLDGEVLQ
jgi:NAD(P) transhydrogenase subunit alpha